MEAHLFSDHRRLGPKAFPVRREVWHRLSLKARAEHWRLSGKAGLLEEQGVIPVQHSTHLADCRYLSSAMATLAQTSDRDGKSCEFGTDLAVGFWT
jgi:hypothetical protein